ncbi:NAD(P)H-dependent oxidoreductase [Pedobacter sp. SYP-B3415]|uniref:NAD(P)H-dependent oxidoreductase n=1 Tax=Pedobacter sp. SYP-B3415 TaxID=2496641 RepID=UPI00101B78A8|nr:NAD(P)H-dependent oxidoreductase [Pedobacter sp. SYP-B3415]
MMKVLIIVAHPNLEQSFVNKRWVAELTKFPDRYHIHDLYFSYPDGAIDVEAEQKLITQFDRVVFQFPLYWFNCPPLLKHWLDVVLTDGWSYGRGSAYPLRGKKISLAISAGIDEKEYAPGGRYKYTLGHLTSAFELTFEYVQATYKPLFAFYGREYHGTLARLEESVPQYLKYLDQL